MKVLILGATGLVGRSALVQAVTHPVINQVVGFRSLTILRPSIIGGERDESRFAEGIALRLAGILAPILPKKFHVDPAATIAAVLVDSVVAAEPGCHYRYAESLV